MNLAIGFFDGVHVGHRRILAGADAVLTFSNHPLTVLAPDRAPPLLMDVGERISMLETVGAKTPRMVDAIRFTRDVASMTVEGFADFLRDRYPELERIHCGGNWRFGANGAGTPATLRSLGFDVKVVRYAKYEGERVSSTRIRSALAEGEVEEANAMLGRRFAAEGMVVRGKGLGRSLNAPTLNVAVAPPLKLGVYVVETPLGRGVANYGVAPTMGRMAWAAPVLEVHIVGGAAIRSAPPSLRVEFLSFLRPERTFPSASELSRQIAADMSAAEGLISAR